MKTITPLVCVVTVGMLVDIPAFGAESCTTGSYQDGIKCLEKKLETSTALPTGLIAFFALKDCPAGWKSVTDAGDRYIVAAGPRRQPKTTGGSDSVALQGSQLPSHSHKILVVLTNDWQRKNQQYPGFVAIGRGVEGKPPTGGIETRLTEEDGGKGSPIEIAPPYYALTMCEKT